MRKRAMSGIDAAIVTNPATCLAIVATLAYWPRICACPRA
jgi:hypothetical protein